MLQVSEQVCRRLLGGAGHGLVTEATIIGPAAAALTLDQSFRLSTLDVTVPSELFDHLALQADWVHEGDRLQNAAGTITAYVLPVGHIGNRRCWQSKRGLKVACLPETYTWLNNSSSFGHFTSIIRSTIQSPRMAMLAPRTVEYLMPDIERLCPSEWQYDSSLQPYLRILATGINTVNTCYGDPEIEQANTIVGECELPVYGVRALYHNGFCLFDDMHWLLRHLERVGVSPKAALLALCGDAYSDAVLGNGRKRNNPAAYDELRAAQLVRSHALQLGCSAEDAKRMFEIVKGTTFSWETGRQEGASSPDPLVRAVVGADLRVLAWPDSPHVTFAVAAEDGLTAAFSDERVVGRAMAERGIEPVSLEAVLGFVDQHPDDRPNVNGRPHKLTVSQWFGRRLMANADFHSPNVGYEYPHDWSFKNDEMRFANADYLRGVGARVLAGASLQEEYLQALEFARDAYEWFDSPE